MYVAVDAGEPYHLGKLDGARTLRFGALVVTFERGNKFSIESPQTQQSVQIDEADAEDALKFMLRYFEPCFDKSDIHKVRETNYDPALAIYGNENALHYLEKGRVDLARDAIKAVLVLLDHLFEGKRAPTSGEWLLLLPPGGKLSVRTVAKTNGGLSP